MTFTLERAIGNFNSAFYHIKVGMCMNQNRCLNYGKNACYERGMERFAYRLMDQHISDELFQKCQPHI